ncbi:TPA: hypothetical protein SHC48_006304 [Pseudomonas aeruginosa]|nr:hypothetical protein [Pseudomonas aeruginosa]HEH4901544.1 hypothetical protein [Pseudomonas aeruginosa]HEH4951931.1 hypothetical protein [Pseudomonas aeruginosa]
MTESKICTCPSGDGSLVHPCPAHPAVEQAGANVGHGHVLPRADGVKMRCGGPGLCSECTADASRARAALAQPSPAQTQPSPAPTLRAAIDVANDRFEVPVAKWGTDLVGEEERPEVAEVAFVLRNIGAMDAEDIDGDNVDLRFEDAEGRDTGCDVSIVEYAEKAADLFEQRDRIVGELRTEIAMLRSYESEWELLLNQHEQERDSALARVEELDKQCRDDVARALGLRPSKERGFAWSYLLASIKSCVKASEDTAQAQHSVPEEFSFEYRHPNGECHTVTVSREQVINEMPDFLFEALCSKLCDCEPVGETNVVECRCDEYAEEFKLLAAAPGKEGL